MCGDNKKRILFINHWSKHLGGAEYSLIDILEEITKREDLDVYLLTSEKGLLHKKLENIKIHYKIVPCSPKLVNIKRIAIILSIFKEWRAIFSFFLFLLRTYFYVSHLKPFCIHANVPKSHVTLFFLCLMGYKGKSIIHMREIFDKKSIAYFIYTIFSKIKRIEVIAVSKSVKLNLPISLQKRTEVLYNGVKITENKRRLLNSYPVRFLYLGRIVKWKRCDLLIMAFVNVIKNKKRGSSLLTIAGNLNYGEESYIELLKKLIHQSNVEDVITIDVNVEDPVKILCSNDVLCMPSIREPFGRVAAEAQGCALPVIGFNEGGLSEIVIHGVTGILVEEGNLKKFQEAIEYFIDNPEQISIMGEKGRLRVLEMFNKEKQIPLIVKKILSDS